MVYYSNNNSCEVRGMRKYLIGVIIGAILLFGAQTFADSLIGKKVDGVVKVTVDGSELETAAVVIEGVSYAPLRAVAESLQLEVEYSDGVVMLSRQDKEDSNLQEQIKDEIRREIEAVEKEKEIEKIQNAIRGLEEQLRNPEEYGLYTEESKDIVRQIIEKHQNRLRELQNN